MSAPVVPIRITADEINCLIYSYLQDSGFKHSAFTICMEGRLESSPHFTKHIPRGELVELLGKALLYLEVESHWKGDALTTNCKTGFSLLEPHVCSLEPPSTATPNLLQTMSSLSVKDAKANGTTNAIPDTGAKRKSDTPTTDDGRAEKRTRRDPDEMDVDPAAQLSKPKPKDAKDGPPESVTAPPAATTAADTPPKKTAKPKPRIQGPVDTVTDPDAIRLLQGHKTEVFVCAWNPVKHNLLATGSKDAVVNIWDLPGPPRDGGFAPPHTKPPIMLDHFAKSDQGDLTSLHWNADGTLLAIGSYDSVLRICTQHGGLYYSHPQHQGPIFATRFSKSGKWLLTASLDGTACVWDVREKRLHRQYRCHLDCCLDVDWIDENTFGSCGADQLIHIMKVDEADPIKTLSGHLNEINQIKCNPSRTRLASCSDDMTARVWNVANIYSAADSESIPGLVASEHVVVLEGHKHSVSSIGWCSHQPAGTHEILATSSFDGTARLWDSVTGDCLKVFTDHKRPVYALAFSPDGHWFATGSGDGWLHIYNISSMEKRWSWYAGVEKPGVFEIDWQRSGSINRIALALECRQVGVVDISRIPALQDS